MTKHNALFSLALAGVLASFMSLLGCPSSEGPVVCGGLQGLACDKGDFCNFAIDAQCGAADQTGTCEAVPEACTKEYAPVCGCDDRTYGNACMAHSAGVSVAREGECEPTAVSCDRRDLRCRRAEPMCPEGQVPEIVNGCYGPCVVLEACACDEAADCPNEAVGTCHLNRGRCGPYVR